MDYIWGDASVGFPDWHGTVQLDEIRTRRSLNEITGVPDHWRIVGLDWGGGEELDHRANPRSQPHEMSAVVVPAEADIDALVEQHGHLPVTMLALHNVDPYAVIKAMTHVVEFRMRRRNVVGLTMRVTESGDIPEQS